MRRIRAIGGPGFTRVDDIPGRCTLVFLLALPGLLASGPMNAIDSNSALPGRHAGTGIVVGLEYAVLDNLRLVQGMARAYAETGMTGMKHYPEAVAWGAMQTGADRPIDFTKLDWFVREYQRSGFTELTVCLKPHCRWGSKHISLLSKDTNPSPKSEYRPHFERWVSAVVERYDGDGAADMPGLRWPVRYIEIGSELSSYEPEPVTDYLDTLGLAYRAAHRANPNVLVGHVAFLITPVDLNVDDPVDYPRAWAETKLPDKSHGLADQRAVLDQPQIFDFVNVHNLGWPYEIEDIVRWLKYEMGLRRYHKPIVVSDTFPTSYIGWGPATVCTGPRLGTLVVPATEADRCHIAEFFKRLVDKDPATLAWTRGFVAADHVQRTIVAAEQGVSLINLSYTGDISFATWPLFQAGAGISAWAGALHVEMLTGAVRERYPLFVAIKQLMSHLEGYVSVERVPYPDDRVRVYLVKKESERFWVAWYNPAKVVLPDAEVRPSTITIDTGSARVVLEPVVTKLGQAGPVPTVMPTAGGIAKLTVTRVPVFVIPQ
ncbi:MAG: hypothetical protein HYX75_19390 [Acidobacteria bacterium]|nr:hypothetical protein [Acidobacteriota bacterium]